MPSAQWQALFCQACAHGDYANAETAMVRALQEDPDDAAAHLNLAHMLLTQKKFGPGWREWEWRRKGEGAKYIPHISMFWNGMELAAPLLVTATEGFGDALMFGAYLPLARERVPSLIFAVPPEFASLARQMAGVDAVITDLKQAPAIAAYCEVSDLPGLLGGATVPPVNHIALNVAPVPGRVGHAFSGRGDNTLAHLRDLPGAHQKTLLSYPADWVDLGRQATDLTIEDLAKRVAQCQVVVASDNLRVHLAGVLGRPAVVMLSKVADWRYFQGSDCPWYPQHALVRQDTLDDWAPVIAQTWKHLDALGVRKVG